MSDKPTCHQSHLPRDHHPESIATGDAGSEGSGAPEPEEAFRVKEKHPRSRRPDLTSWTSVEEVILQRRSIRAFKKEPIPDFMIRRILEAGRFAPSAGNAQPWKFAVVNHEDIICAMEEDAVKMIKIIMWFLDYTRSTLRNLLLRPIAKLIIRFKKNLLHPVPFGLMRQIAQGQTPVFHNAPTLILLYEDTRGVSCPATDIGICGQNMVLAAHSMGVGACWIGLIKVLMFRSKWKKFFQVTYPYKLKSVIALGWPKVPADGQVPREVQLVTWYDGGVDHAPRIEQQGA